MSRDVRIGIIGCGGIANGKHMPSLKRVPEAKMVAFCDIIEEKAIKAAKEYGEPDAKVYTDYKELLKDESIEVIHVLTPNRSHADITIDALRAGKHVMCEKPMAKTAADAKRMVEAAKETGKKLTIGYQHRHKTASQYAKQYIDRGDLGEIYYANCYAIRRRGTPNWGVFLNDYEQGGGPIIDIATHSLDLTLYLMNNYEPAYCVGQTFHKLNKQTNTGNPWGDWDTEKFTAEDSAFGFIVMKNGAVINLRSSWALNYVDAKDSVTLICGTEGGADMPKSGELRINGVKNGRQYVMTPDLSAGGVVFYDGKKGPSVTAAECQCFLDAILGRGELAVTAEAAACVTRILEGIYISAKTGTAYHFNR
jgi:predicted dehydrogenase